MSCRMALVRTYVSNERITSVIRMTIISELVFFRCLLRLLVTANLVPCSPILVTLMMEAINCS
jgi:hypothetical protein